MGKEAKVAKIGLSLSLKLGGGGVGEEVQICWGSATKPQAVLWSARQFG